MPSATIVEILGVAGISEVRTRAALSRMQRDGILELRRNGRATSYRVAQDRALKAAPRVQRILAFGESDEWERKWCLVAFSIPEGQKEIRHQLRSRLHWLGYAPLYDGLWISPTSDPEPARRDLDSLSIDAATVMVVDADELFSRKRRPLDAWSLEPIRHRYHAFIRYCDLVVAAADESSLGEHEATATAVIITDAFREFPQVDPALPLAMMPPAWPRAEGRRAYLRALRACESCSPFLSGEARAAGAN